MGNTTEEFGKTISEPIELGMEIFDDLPAELRKVLREANGDYAVTGILEYIATCPSHWDDEKIISVLMENIRFTEKKREKEHYEFYEKELNGKKK